MKPTIIKNNGTKIWLNKDSLLHRVDGPAIKYMNRGDYWLNNRSLLKSIFDNWTLRIRKYYENST